MTAAEGFADLSWLIKGKGFMGTVASTTLFS